MTLEFNNIHNVQDEVNIIENEDLVEAILEINAEGNTYDNQCRLVNGINEGVFLIPVLPCRDITDTLSLQFECMACIDKPTGDKYLPLCTDKASLDRFVNGMPHNTLCLSFEDIAMLLEGLDDFVSIAISSRFLPGDLCLPPSALAILAARREEPVPKKDEPIHAVH